MLLSPARAWFRRQAFVTLHFASLQEASFPNSGASGAVAAVLGAYA